MAEKIQGCARVTGAAPDTPAPSPVPAIHLETTETTMTARVGQKAPEFTAPAYYKGDFTQVKLSDYFGKWILLCFYPGDFTFV